MFPVRIVELIQVFRFKTRILNIFNDDVPHVTLRQKLAPFQPQSANG